MLKHILFIFSLLIIAIVIPVQGIETEVKEIIISESNPEMAASAYALKVQEIYSESGLAEAGLSLAVFEKAFTGYLNLKGQGALSGKPLLTVIDFEKSSTQKRFWVIDLEKKEIVFNTLVAHGRNTGNEFAKNFSNQPESFMSSLGFYITDQLYVGKHGLSLKLHGMDQDFNSNALQRAVVMHGADYVSEKFIRQHGRIGRSLGCPALPVELNEEVITTINNGTCLYIHYPEKNYSSKYLNTHFAIEQLLQVSPESMPAEAGNI